MPAHVFTRVRTYGPTCTQVRTCASSAPTRANTAKLLLNLHAARTQIFGGLRHGSAARRAARAVHAGDVRDVLDHGADGQMFQQQQARPYANPDWLEIKMWRRGLGFRVPRSRLGAQIGILTHERPYRERQFALESAVCGI